MFVAEPEFLDPTNNLTSINCMNLRQHMDEKGYQSSLEPEEVNISSIFEKLEIESEEICRVILNSPQTEYSESRMSSKIAVTDSKNLTQTMSELRR